MNVVASCVAFPGFCEPFKQVCVLLPLSDYWHSEVNRERWHGKVLVNRTDNEAVSASSSIYPRRTVLLVLCG